MSAGYHFIPVEPMGAPRQVRSDTWNPSSAVTRYRQYKDAVRAHLPTYELPGHLSLRFYIAMPKSWSNRKRAELDGKPHQQKPDVDNLAKAFMDAFHSEDKHVHSLHVEKFWAVSSGIEVWL